MREPTERLPAVRRRPTLSRTDKANLITAWIAAAILGTLLGLIRAAALAPAAAPAEIPPAPSVSVVTEVTTILEPTAVPAAPTRRAAVAAPRTPHRTTTAPSVVRCAYAQPLDSPTVGVPTTTSTAPTTEPPTTTAPTTTRTTPTVPTSTNGC